MKKCIAFSAIPGSRAAWIPCVRRAQIGYALCRRHSDVIAGVMLGVCASGLLEDALKRLEKKQFDEKPRQNIGKAKSAVGRKIRKLNMSTRKRRAGPRAVKGLALKFAKVGRRTEKTKW